MDKGKFDMAKTDKRLEESPNNVKPELSEEELSLVSGGSSKLVLLSMSGKHFEQAEITVRKDPPPTGKPS